MLPGALEGLLSLSPLSLSLSLLVDRSLSHSLSPSAEWPANSATLGVLIARCEKIFSRHSGIVFAVARGFNEKYPRGVKALAFNASGVGRDS